MSIFKFENESNNSDLAAIVYVILEYIKILFLIEPQIVFDVLKKLKEKKENIRDLFEYVGEIDSNRSIALLRDAVPYYCKPTFVKQSKFLKTKGIYHPLIINSISNDLDINGKSILLTGSNMSGKTTFIRTIEINILMAQTINTCFAESIELSPMNIYSAIRISDDLLNSKSYYLEEVQTIKKMIDESSNNGSKIFFLDEIFKGTNTIERIAAGKAVLSYLDNTNNIVFVSTHDIELAEMLTDSYDLYHFTEIVSGNDVFFDYKLKKGMLTTRNAIKILKLNCYPSEIIDEAMKIANLQKKM